MNSKYWIMKLIMMVLVACLCSTILYGQVTVDFTDPNTATYTLLLESDPNYQPAQYQDPNTGMMMMWAGNADGNSTIVYGGAATDILPMFNDVLNNPANTSGSLLVPYSGYHISDCNLDGNVVYGGAATDILVIFNSVRNNPANTSGSLLISLIEQIPGN